MKRCPDAKLGCCRWGPTHWGILPLQRDQEVGPRLCMVPKPRSRLGSQSTTCNWCLRSIRFLVPQKAVSTRCYSINYSNVDVLSYLDTSHGWIHGYYSKGLYQSFRYRTTGLGIIGFPCNTVSILIQAEVQQQEPRLHISYSAGFMTLHVRGEWRAPSIIQASLSTVRTRYICDVSTMSMLTMVTIQRAVCILLIAATNSGHVCGEKVNHQQVT